MREYINLFISYLQNERNYSVHTASAYLRDLLQFERFLNAKEPEYGEKCSVDMVDMDIVRQWMMLLMKQAYTPESVNRKLSTLKSFFKYLVRQDIIEKHPLYLVTGPKKAKPLPCFIKEKDINALLDEESGVDFENIRNRLILEMFYETGIRRFELSYIQKQDVDIDTMQIRVTGKRKKQRLIPFAGRLKEMIIHYNNARKKEVGDKNSFFFVRKNGEAMTPSMVYYVVKKKLQNIPTLAKRSPHVLRHTFATSMLNNGAEINTVKNLLGHSSLASTSIYTHVSFEELKKMYNAHPRAKK